MYQMHIPAGRCQCAHDETAHACQLDTLVQRVPARSGKAGKCANIWQATGADTGEITEARQYVPASLGAAQLLRFLPAQSACQEQGEPCVPDLHIPPPAASHLHQNRHFR